MEPVNAHHALCNIWLSADPADECDCNPVARRQHLENEWAALSLRERCARYDDYATR